MVPRFWQGRIKNGIVNRRRYLAYPPPSPSTSSLPLLLLRCGNRFLRYAHEHFIHRIPGRQRLLVDFLARCFMLCDLDSFSGLKPFRIRRARKLYPLPFPWLCPTLHLQHLSTSSRVRSQATCIFVKCQFPVGKQTVPVRRYFCFPF